MSRCGTTQGYDAHRAAGTPYCQPCRDAAAAYMRQYRSRPEVQRREKVNRGARERALTRLAAEHPTRFAILLNDELAKEGP
jgi:hypothetical protein